MRSLERQENIVEDIRERKEEYVNNIAEESNMESEEEREIIRQALDKKIITEEFSGVQTEEDRIEPSLLEDIKYTVSSKGASRGRAEITSVEVGESDIKITFSIIGRDDRFTKTYDIPQSDTVSRELGDLMIMANTDNLNELKDCTVPVIPSNSYGDISYTLYKPPRERGLATRLRYRFGLISRKFELLRHNIGGRNKDVYTPTGRLYAILLPVPPLLLLAGSIGLAGFTLCILSTLFVMHIVLLTECE